MYFEWLDRLTEQDRAQIVEIIDDVAVHETTMGYHEPLSPRAARVLTDSIDHEIRTGAAHLLVFRDPEAGGRIVAMVTMTPHKLPARKHVVEFKRVVIARAHRTRGRLLLHMARQSVIRAEEMGCDRLILDVRADGPERLWRRLGFEEYGRLEDYARVEGRTIAGIFMQSTPARVNAAIAAYAGRELAGQSGRV